MDLGYAPQPGFEAYQRKEYAKGREAAKADLRAGILAWKTTDGGLGEAWQVLWCYWKILKVNYGIEYETICHPGLPGPDAEVAGYQKVMRPVIDARLGIGWEERIFREAQSFHRNQWETVVDEYRRNPHACGTGF
jgi:hypothetical protein